MESSSGHGKLPSLFVSTENPIEGEDMLGQLVESNRPRADSGTNFRARYYRQLRMPVPYCPIVQADVCSAVNSPRSTPHTLEAKSPDGEFYSALIDNELSLSDVGVPVVVYKPSAGFTKSVFNLSNTTVGAGTLLLPFAIAKCGYIPGLCLLAFISLCAAYSLHILVQVGRHTGSATYMESARRCMGDMGEWFVKITIIILTFGALASYLVIIGDYFTELIGVIPGVNTKAWWCHPLIMGGFTFFAVLPLSMLKDMSSLSFASLLSLGAVIYVIGLVTYEAAWYIKEHGGVHPSVKWETVTTNPLGLLQALPIMGLAFVNQVNIYQIVGELKRPTPTRANMVIDCTSIICTMIYGITGVMGYFRFGSEVDGNVLSDPDTPNNAAFYIAKGAMGMCVVLSYPLVLFPCRACLDTIIHKALARCLKPDKGDKPPMCGVTNMIFILETVLIVTLSYLVAASIPKITVLFSLTFALTGPSIVYFMPALFYIRLMDDRWYHPKMVLCYGLIVVGTCILILSLYGSVVDIMGLVKELTAKHK